MRRQILPALALYAIALDVGGASIRYTASGTISPNFGTVPVPAGTAVSLDVTIDQFTADTNVASNAGTYPGLSGTLTVGSDAFSVNGYAFRQARVNNDSDQIQLAFLASGFTSGGTPTIGGIRLQNVFFTLFASSNTAISNDLLASSVGLNLAQWPTREVVIQFATNTGYVGEALGPMNTFTSAVIPIPAAAWLFGGALGLLAALRQKATKCAV